MKLPLTNGNPKNCNAISGPEATISVSRLPEYVVMPTAQLDMKKDMTRYLSYSLRFAVVYHPFLPANCNSSRSLNATITAILFGRVR